MIYFWVIIAYLVILIGVGAYRSKFVKNQDDFMVAGRRLSAKVLVGTLLATWIGSGSIIASAGLAYDRGFPALWFDAGVWVAIIILYFIAGRARAFAQYTVPDILEARYNKYARLLGTIVTIIAYTAIVSYQFRAGGMVLNLVTGIPVNEGIIITALFVIGYTVLAGLISVAYTDVVNGIIMIIGLFIALPFLIDNAGGWSNIAAALPEEHFSVMGNMTIQKALAYALPTMLLLLGESGMYQRFFSAKDSRTARRSVIGWISGTIIIETLIVVLAIVGAAIFTDIDGEMVILYAVKDGLPIIIGAIALAAIVAVIVSTADSFLLVPATNIMRDIYQRFINPDVSQKKLVLYSRITVVLLGLIAYLQVQFFEKVLEMALYAYTMYGVGITPAVMGAFFWKRTTAAGGVASIAAGMLITLVWEILGQPFGLETVYPALVGSLGCLFFVSLLTKKPNENKWQPFFGGSKRK
jgi:SSS family solute:Na+ symporter/sodium/proline symporter